MLFKGLISIFLMFYFWIFVVRSKMINRFIVIYFLWLISKHNIIVNKFSLDILPLKRRD